MSINNLIKPGDVVELFNNITYTNTYTSLILFKTLKDAKRYRVPQLGRFGGIPEGIVVKNPSRMIVLEAETKETEPFWAFKLLSQNKFGWVSMANPYYVPRMENSNLYQFGIKKYEYK